MSLLTKANIRGSAVRGSLVLGIVRLAIFLIAFWDLKWGIAMLFVMSNRETSFQCNFYWLFSGPLAVVPLLFLSLIGKRVGSASLVLSCVLFTYVSLRYYPFGYSTGDIIQNLLFVCGPMLAMAIVQTRTLKSHRGG
jgi:hypothetical protein